MRTVPLASVSILVAVIVAALMSRLPENIAVALVVAPFLVCIICSLLLTLSAGGWRRSQSLKELLLYGPLQAVPDTWTHRVARVPTVFLSIFAAVALGAIAGMFFLSAS
jgi:phosphate/sulfate permease